MSDHSSSSCTRLDLAFANLITRLWVAMRLVMAGVDKFRAGDGADATFNTANYQVKTEQIAKLMNDNSFLPSFLSAEMINQYAHNIGYALIAVGAWVAVGLLSEFALLAAGITFLSLGFGVAALPDDLEMNANIGIGILLTAIALYTNKSGYLSLDGLFGRHRSKKRSTTEAESEG